MAEFNLYEAMKSGGYLDDTPPVPADAEGGFSLYDAMQKGGYLDDTPKPTGPNLNQSQQDYANQANDAMMQRLNAFNTMPRYEHIPARQEAADPFAKGIGEQQYVEERQKMMNDIFSQRQHNFVNFSGENSGQLGRNPITGNAQGSGNNIALLTNQMLGGSDGDMADMVKNQYGLPVYQDDYGHRYTINPHGNRQNFTKDDRSGIEGEYQYIDDPSFNVMDAMAFGTQALGYGKVAQIASKVGGGSLLAGATAGAAEGVANAGAQVARNLARDGTIRYSPGEGALTAIGGGLGGGLARKVNVERVGGKSNYDIAQLLKDDPYKDIVLEQSETLGELSQKTGIELTAGERTGSPLMLNMQKVLGSMDEGEAAARAFDKRRGAQIENAVAQQLDSVAPQGSRLVAADNIIGIANKEMDRLESRMAARGDMNYSQAFSESAPLTLETTESLIDDLIAIKKDMPTNGRKNIDDIIRELAPLDDKGNAIADKLTGNLEDLHKRALKATNDMITSAETKNPALTRDLTRAKEALLNRLDSSKPYQEARVKYAEDFNRIEDFKQTALGKIDDNSRKNRYSRKPTRVGYEFLGDDHVTAARYKDQILRSGVEGEAAWRDYIRGYFDSVIDKKIKPNKTNSAKLNDVANRYAGYAHEVTGTKDSREMLRALMPSKAHYDGMIEVMDVIKAAAKSVDNGSDTVAKQVARDAVTGGGRIRAALTPRESIIKLMETRLIRKRAKELNDLFYTEEGMKHLANIGATISKIERNKALEGLITYLGVASGQTAFNEFQQ